MLNTLPPLILIMGSFSWSSKECNSLLNCRTPPWHVYQIISNLFFRFGIAVWYCFAEHNPNTWETRQPVTKAPFFVSLPYWYKEYLAIFLHFIDIGYELIAGMFHWYKCVVEVFAHRLVGCLAAMPINSIMGWRANCLIRRDRLSQLLHVQNKGVRPLGRNWKLCRKITP